jgi:hypothetical protein
MENFSYHVPFYVVTGGIKLDGHSSELTPGQVGLFDRSTWSVATGAGLGKEFFFAQGHTGGKDWYGTTVTESHKSPFFLGRDVENIYESLPQRLQNEEWVLGFNGSTSSKGLTYEKGKAIRVKFYFFGQPTYRFFGGPKEYVVSYTPPVGCDEPCVENDCPDPIVDCLTHTQALINEINNHVELRKFGVQAKLVNAPYVAGTATNTKYCISLCDNGDSLALQAVQAQAPVGVTVERTARAGAISTYQFCQPDAADAPVDFTQTGSVLQAVCDTCPAGSTLVAAKDVYIVRRLAAAATDLTTDAARDTYADTVGTAYGVAGDADKTYLGLDGAVAIVKVKAAAGATLNPIGSDTVEFSHTEPAQCVFANPAPIAWDTCGVGISSSRTLRINSLNRPDCDAAGDRLADLTEILSGVKGIKIGTLTKIAGLGCVDDYTVEQDSIDCLPEDCLTNNVTFSYDTLPSFENRSWEVVPPVVTEDGTRKCGIRVTAGYVDPKNSNCTFDITSYYENEPVKFELSLLEEDGSACDAATWPTVHQSRIGRIARQSGEWVIREVIMKDASYLRHMATYDNDPLQRERFEVNVVGRVDRNAYYKLYYVTFGASYGNSFRKNEQEKFTAVFAFKEGDASAAAFEAQILGVLEAKSGVSLHINE